MLDAMPGAPRLDDSGQVRLSRSGLGILTVCVIPLLSILGHGGYLCYLLFA